MAARAAVLLGIEAMEEDEDEAVVKGVCRSVVVVACVRVGVGWVRMR